MSVTAGKYLGVDNTTGQPTEQTANQSSAGAGDAGKIVSLNAAGLIDETMLPATLGQTMTASEAISAGALINVWNSSGALKVRNADNSGSKPAHGFAPAAILSAASGTIILNDGVISGLSGLTIGTQYFLGTVGGVTSTVPTAGNIVQAVGVALSTTSLAFELSATWIQR